MYCTVGDGGAGLINSKHDPMGRNATLEDNVLRVQHQHRFQFVGAGIHHIRLKLFVA